MVALRERAVNLLEEGTRRIREHTSQGLENGSPRNSAVAGAVNERETNRRVQENFRNLFQPYTACEGQPASQAAADSGRGRRRQLQLLKEGNGTQQ